MWVFVDMFWLLRPRLVELGWWDFPKTLARIPHLNNDVKDLAVDDPGCAAQNVQPGIHEFDVALLRRMVKVRCLLNRFLETHRRSWKTTG